jgi:hypothetical protein
MFINKRRYLMAKSKAEAAVENAIHEVAKEAKESGCCSDKSNRNMNMGGHAGGGAVYGLGLIGALVYFIQHATSFGDGLLGILKAIVWPALLIYQLLLNYKI